MHKLCNYLHQPLHHKAADANTFKINLELWLWVNLGRSGARDSIRLGINWQTPSPLCSIPARSLGGGSGGEERLIIEWMVIECQGGKEMALITAH